MGIGSSISCPPHESLTTPNTGNDIRHLDGSTMDFSSALFIITAAGIRTGQGLDGFLSCSILRMIELAGESSFSFFLTLGFDSLILKPSHLPTLRVLEARSRCLAHLLSFRTTYYATYYLLAERKEGREGFRDRAAVVA